MQRHITKIFDIYFLLLFEQFHITKKSGELCRIFWTFCILFVNIHKKTIKNFYIVLNCLVDFIAMLL